MEIIYTREEVIKIILAHARATTSGYEFNTVKAGDYNVFPRKFEVAFEAPEQTEINCAAQ